MTNSPALITKLKEPRIITTHYFISGDFASGSIRYLPNNRLLIENEKCEKSS